MANALASKASVRKDLGVRIPRAPLFAPSGLRPEGAFSYPRSDKHTRLQRNTRPPVNQPSTRSASWGSIRRARIVGMAQAAAHTRLVETM